MIKKTPLTERFANLLGVGSRFRRSTAGRAQTGKLVDIFAAFVALDSKVDRAEAEVALDLLRHAFPETDHGWLARRLHRSLASPRPPATVAQGMKDDISHERAVSLGFQLYLLVHSSAAAYRGMEAFREVMAAIEASDAAEAIHSVMSGEDFGEPLPFDRVRFGSTTAHIDVDLGTPNKNHAFHAYRAEDIIIIRNTGDTVLWLSGSSIHPGKYIRMRPQQSIRVEDWNLTTEDIQFYLNAGRTGHIQSLYLNETPTGTTVERVKSRHSTLRLDFGFNVSVEVFSETTIHSNKHPQFVQGERYELSAADSLIIRDGSETQLETLRKQSLSAGKRFRMSSEHNICRVSNDPAAVKKGDILLTPGLAKKAILEVEYDAQSTTGELKVIESGELVLVNGKPVRETCHIADGSLIRLSSNQGVRCRFSEGLLDEERTVIRSLEIDGLHHRFRSGQTVLDNISFQIQRGEMLCIMGPSGCGKSTLLATLAGHLRPNRGHIRLNGSSLYQNRKELSPFIASMHQEEAINPQITLREHLMHAARIRRPHNSSREVRKRVDSILADLGLQAISHIRAGSADEKTISGGERSRLNLGLDIGSSAEIFLFDEPISGLSSKDSEHVAETLHVLSQDSIVIASLHRPGARVLRLFDKVLMLDQGGRVAYFGTPAGMTNYFHTACQELNIIPPQQLKQQLLGADFVFDVMETPLHGSSRRDSGAVRRFPSTFWQERFESSQLVDEVARGETPDQSQLGNYHANSNGLALPSRSKRQIGREWFRLFQTHFSRSLLSKFRNRGTIWSILLEAPILALLIGFTLRASADGAYHFHSGLHMPVYLFLTVTIGMFLGLTNSASEILRDSPTLRRERNCRPGIFFYVLAKFLVLALLASIQCAAYVLIGQNMLDIHGMFFNHWQWMTLTAVTGTAMALVVSSMVKSERAALSSVPLLLVPQILLAGALVSFDEMNRGMFEGADDGRASGAEPIPARAMPLRYAYEGMMVNQATENTFERERRKVQKKIETLKSRVEAGETLSAEEAERLRILRESLLRLMGAEALSADKAAELSKTYSSAGRRKSMDEVLAIPPYPDEISDDSLPIQHYFVNERVDLLVGKADADRTDWRQATKRSIFLAEKKYWLGITSRTTRACAWVLWLFTVCCLIVSTLILRSKSNKVT